MADAGVSLVYVVCGSEEEALAISRTLVQERLAACTNVWPIRSVYTWQGELRQDVEVALLIKTVPSRVGEVSDRVRALHSYELPCVLTLEPGYVEPGYASWIAEGATTDEGA